MIFSELSAMFHAKGSKASDRYSRGRLGVWKIRKRRGTPIQNEKASIRSIPNYFVKQNCIDHPITHEGQIFKNKKVYVVPFELPESQTLEFMLSINGKFDEGVSIRRHGDLEAVLSTNGASCFACNPKGGVDLLIGPPTQLISDSKVFQRIQDGSDTDIVRIEYIFRCLKEGAVCKPTGAEYLHVSKAARAYGFDKYGDHLQDFASKASLESLLLAKIRHNKKSKTDLSLTHMEQHNVSVDEARRILAKEELDPLFTVYTPFRDAVLYVDKYAATRIDSGDSEALDDRYRYSVLEASELLALLHDAKISPCFDSHVTHVITSLSPTSERYSSLMKQRATIMGTRGEHRLPRFVGPNWIVSVATSGRPWQECDESLVSSE